MTDPYETLGVSRRASASDIKQAYRKLAQELHPDRNPDPHAEERFKAVTQAYDVLSDPKKKRLYDQYGPGGLREGFDPRTQAPFGGGRPIDIEDLLRGTGFGDVFGANRRRRRPRATKGADFRTKVAVSFQEALTGTEKELRFERADIGAVRCRVPQGVRDGETIRIRGKGERGPGGSGDLLLDVAIDPHPLFRREGEDLHITVPISLREAVEGAKVRVPTPDGAVMVKVPPETDSGTVLRLRGRGVKRKGEPGDLRVHLHIALPKPSADRQARVTAFDDLYEGLRDELERFT
ncbi:MAG: DnaJ C-terminal domain-containing protein [Myxococcota bacterium]